ncbi:hypothetical protein A2U01_0077268, partial [Trifolium medium]|nr:hypothetical protein [Trifolium medium]
MKKVALECECRTMKIEASDCEESCAGVSTVATGTMKRGLGISQN